MKVILVNGSPHEKGCTYTALQTVAETLNEEGIESVIFQLGSKPLVGCTACGVVHKPGAVSLRTGSTISSNWPRARTGSSLARRCITHPREGRSSPSWIVPSTRARIRRKGSST
jgi:Multimeric flavodoxin WrbA